MSDFGRNPLEEAAAALPEEAFADAVPLPGGFALEMADRGLGAAAFPGAGVDDFLRAADGDLAAATIFFRITFGFRAESGCSPQPHTKANAIRIQASLQVMGICGFIISVSLLGS